MKKLVIVMLCISLLSCNVPEIAAAKTTNDDTKYAIAPQYDDARQFSEGLAAVKKGKKWGFINETGKVVIDFKFDGADENGFHEGLAGVMIGKKWGIIDRSGKTVIKPQFGYILNGFEDGFTGVFDFDPDTVTNASGLPSFSGQADPLDKYGNRYSTFDYDKFVSFSDGIREIKKDGKLGYEDETGRIIIQPVYDEISDFSDEIAVVTKNGKYGLVDNKGNILAEPEYDKIEDFNQGIAKVYKDGYCCLIDKSGTVMVPPVYDYIGDFCDGLAIVSKNGSCGYIDNTGKEIIEPKYFYSFDFSEGLACVEIDGTFGFIDKSGNVVIPAEYGYVSESKFVGGLAPVNISTYLYDDDGYYVDTKYEWYYVDKSGNKVIDINTKYDAALNFLDNVAPVIKDEKYGFIDRAGNEVEAPQYDSYEVLDKASGIIKVEKAGKYGLLDKNGKVIAKTQYDYIDIPMGNVIAFSKNNLYGFFDLKGNEIIKPKYDFYMELEEDPSYISVSINNKNGIIDKNGKEIIKPSYDKITKEGNLFQVYMNKDYNEYFGYIDPSGKVILKPDKYDYEWPTSDDLRTIYVQNGPCIEQPAIINIKQGKLYDYDQIDDCGSDVINVAKNDKWGCIDYNGKEVIKLQYDEIGYFHDKVAVAKRNGKYGFINNKGNTVIDFKYDYANYDCFNDGLATVKMNGKWSFIDMNGKEVLKLTTSYDSVGLLYNGASIVCKNKKYGLIDKNGKEIVKTKYDYIEGPFDNRYYMVESNDKYGIVDNSGKEFLKTQFDYGFTRYGIGNRQESLFLEGMLMVCVNGKYGFIANQDNTPDKGAEKSIKEAVQLNILPYSLQNSYKSQLYRGDFYNILVAFYENKTGKNIIDLLYDKGMYTTNNQYDNISLRKVISAAKLGLLDLPYKDDYSNEDLKSDNIVTREQAAVIFMNVANSLGIDTSSPASKLSDQSSISSSAMKAVDFVCSKGIMSADNGKFNPKSVMTHEEAIDCLVKLFN